MQDHIPLSVAIIAIGWLGIAGSGLQAGDCCPADLSGGDGLVSAADLAELLASWGPCLGCPADLTGDGAVGAADLAELLADWGACNFDYGPVYDNAEATQIGLEMLRASGPLLLDQDDYTRIDRDLGLIRQTEPALASQFHSPAWIPNEMIIRLIDGAPQQGYLCLNEYYQVVDVDPLIPSLNIYLLTFVDDLNIPALAATYAQEPAVEYAEPNGLIGGQNFWEATDLGGGVWRWDIDDGWHDCFDGCDCHRVYVYHVDAAGLVELVSFQEFGQPWCDFD